MINQQELQQKFSTLVKNVYDWAEARGIYDPTDGSRQYDQAVKLIEELGEMASGIKKNKRDVVQDSLGDIMVVIINVFYLGKYGTLDISKLPTNVDFNWSTTLEKEEIVKQNEEFFTRLCKYLAAVIESSRQSMGVNFALIQNVIDCLFILEELQGFETLSSLEMAWDTIKDRKGKMVNGVFVKEEDLA